MDTEQLTEYCALTYKEISNKKKQLDAAQKELYHRMEQNKLEEVKSPFGRFVRYVRATYTFPDDVKSIKDALAAAEERAIAEGRATKEEKTFYKFAELKKDDQF